MTETNDYSQEAAMNASDCETCHEMANSEYGIEEPHEAHANDQAVPMYPCTGCTDIITNEDDSGTIAGEEYCWACFAEYEYDRVQALLAEEHRPF